MLLCRFVPLGLMDWLMKMGCENVIELDWWEENCVPGYDDITFVCTPSQHWSKRTALDDNKVLHLLHVYHTSGLVRTVYSRNVFILFIA